MNSEQICDGDAAYVLGALSAAERREFEAHLTTCERCKGSLAELTSTGAALSALDRDDAVRLLDGPAEESPPVPEGVVDDVASMERARRRRGRLRTAGVAATSAVLGAAAATAVFVAVDPGEGSAPRGSVTAARTVDFSRVGQNNMLGKAELTDMEWGTSISLTADYEGSSDRQGDLVVYQLVAVSDGKREVVGSWTGKVGKQCVVAGASHLDPSQIDALIIQMAPNSQKLMEATVAT